MPKVSTTVEVAMPAAVRPKLQRVRDRLGNSNRAKDLFGVGEMVKPKVGMARAAVAVACLRRSFQRLADDPLDVFDFASKVTMTTMVVRKACVASVSCRLFYHFPVSM